MMRIFLHSASFILALFIGNGMSFFSAEAESPRSLQVAQNIFFWAGHEAMYEDGDRELSIQYSADGRKYTAKANNAGK